MRSLPDWRHGPDQVRAASGTAAPGSERSGEEGARGPERDVGVHADVRLRTQGRNPDGGLELGQTHGFTARRGRRAARGTTAALGHGHAVIVCLPRPGRLSGNSIGRTGPRTLTRDGGGRFWSVMHRVRSVLAGARRRPRRAAFLRARAAVVPRAAAEHARAGEPLQGNHRCHEADDEAAQCAEHDRTLPYPKKRAPAAPSRPAADYRRRLLTGAIPVPYGSVIFRPRGPVRVARSVRGATAGYLRAAERSAAAACASLASRRLPT